MATSVREGEVFSESTAMPTNAGTPCVVEVVRCYRMLLLVFIRFSITSYNSYHCQHYLFIYYPRRRRSTAARILRSFYHTVCGNVCVGVGGWVGVYVSMMKRKPLIGMIWNLAQSKPIGFGFKRSRERVGVVACGSKIMPECSGCNSLWKIHPYLHNALLN